MAAKLRCAVIGLGMGRGHIAGFREHPDAEVVAVADTDAAKLEKFRDELKLPAVYTDPLEMISKERPDVLSVAVPNKFHAELTIAGLEAGCHVLCEKPMAMNAAEAETMLAASRRCGKRLGINFSYRFNPQAYAMKQIVDSGRIGNIYFARTVWMRRRGMPGFGGWFGTRELAGGGPLIDLGVHRLDLALWLMGYPEPEWVMGATYDKIAGPIAAKSGKKFDVEDFACGFIRFKNGASLEIDASWAGNIKEREFMQTRLLGDKGGLLHRNLNESYEFKLECFEEIDGCQFDTELHPPVPECHKSYYTFIDAIVKDVPFTVAPEEGVTVMRLLDAIYESARTGAPVHID